MIFFVCFASLFSGRIYSVQEFKALCLSHSLFRSPPQTTHAIDLCFETSSQRVILIEKQSTKSCRKSKVLILCTLFRLILHFIIILYQLRYYQIRQNVNYHKFRRRHFSILMWKALQPVISFENSPPELQGS